MMRKILTRFAAALLFTTSLVAAVAPATPAAASVPCPQNVVCTYWDTNYGGAMYYYSSPLLPVHRGRGAVGQRHQFGI